MNALGRPPSTGSGPIDLEGKLGLVRADLAYNLYRDWTDRQLYHLSLGARWSWMEQSIRPVVGGGLEVYVPVTVGAFLSAGGEARFGSWRATAELRGGLLGEGPMAGAGIGLQRRY